MTKKDSRALKLGEDLPPHYLAALLKKRLADKELFKGINVDYYPPSPDGPGIVLTDNPSECKFPCRHPFHGDAMEFKRGKKGKGKKGKGKGNAPGNGRGKQKWPDPKVVLAEVQKLFSGVALADNSGDLVFGFTNLEFWLTNKAIWFEDAANEMVKHFHHMGVEEVGAQGILHTGKIAGYAVQHSHENSRHQAVGSLVHPRLKLLAGPFFLDSVKMIQTIQDLRPGLMCIYKDTVSGQIVVTTVLHLKSMIGGAKVTSVVRYKQLQNLVKEKNQLLPVELAKLGITDLTSVAEIVGGDMNFPVNDKSHQDADPLYQDGFQLLAPNDTQGTQAFKDTRLDGLYYKNVKSGLAYYSVYAYYKVPALGRSFTDHGTISGTMSGTAGTTAGGKPSASTSQPAAPAGGTTTPLAPSAGSNTTTAPTTSAPPSTTTGTTGDASSPKSASDAVKTSTGTEKVGGADLKPVKLKVFKGKTHDKRGSRRR